MFYQDLPQLILNQTVVDILTLKNTLPTDREIELFIAYFEDLDEQAYNKYIRPLEYEHGKDWCRSVGVLFNDNI